MLSTTINILDRVPFYRGVAQPRNNQRSSSQQQYLANSISLTMQQRVTAVQNRAIGAVNRIRQSRFVRSIRSARKKVRDFFQIDKIYWKPGYVVLISEKDEFRLQSEPTPIFRMWLNAKKFFNLNPTMPSDRKHDTILEALKNGSVVLDWEALIGIWHGKMLNLGNKHLIKYITGLGCANFENFKIDGERMEFALSTSKLSPKGETVKNIFCLLYLGFAVDTLLAQQPMSITKKSYYVQAYSKKLIFGSSQNTNELMYSLVYKRKLQFSIVENEQLYEQVIELCCIFNIFRIKTSSTTAETRINLASVYPTGPNNDIALSLWENHASQIVPEKIEIKKFNDMKKVFEAFSIFYSIQKIHPDLDTNTLLQNKFKTILRVDSLK